MPQINDIRELALQNARYVSNSPQDWMGYLDVAARLYRYSFTDALLIHAQRPDATACAELELWNQKMSRWVNRGAKGIALLDDTGPRTRLRYVFDDPCKRSPVSDFPNGTAGVHSASVRTGRCTDGRSG